jgi:hypothetical protein
VNNQVQGIIAKKKSSARARVRGGAVLCIALLGIAGCARKTQHTQLGNQSGSVAEETQTPRVRMPYVIPEAGVHFNPPLSWDPDRITVVTLSGDDAAAQEPGADYSVSFNYKAEQPAHENSPLVRLFVVKRSQWTRNSDSGRGEVIDSTGDWVFVAALPKDVPYRPDLLDADQFAHMRMSLDEVKDAFTVESGGPSDTSLRAESQRR